MKTPREVLLDVEDWIDYPPHMIYGTTADKVLEDFAAEGYVIIPAAEVAAMTKALREIADLRYDNTSAASIAQAALPKQEKK